MAAGRPFPQLVEDDVIDYLITEAVYLRVAHEDEKFRKEAEQEAEREQFKRESVDELAKYRGGIK
jgi:response regulator of citrate/malate metabolism